MKFFFDSVLAMQINDLVTRLKMYTGQGSVFLNIHNKISANTTVLTLPDVQGLLFNAIVLLQFELENKIPPA